MRHYDVQVFGGGHDDEAAQHTEKNIIDLTKHESQHQPYKLTQRGPEIVPDIILTSPSDDLTVEIEPSTRKVVKKKIILIRNIVHPKVFLVS